jgi:uncharacterized membrane protein
MNLENIISGQTGLIHLVFAIAALILGTIVILKPKGTRNHKKIGYFYLISMLGLNLTAFMIYRLYNSFGIFHWLAVISLLTISAGMTPMLLRSPKNYVTLHFNFMFWSVIGLYAAFFAETLTRIPDVVIESGIPNSTFYSIAGVTMLITMGVGAFFIIINWKKWTKFDQSKS